MSKSSYLIPDLPPSLSSNFQGAEYVPQQLFPSTQLPGLGIWLIEEHLLSMYKGPGIHPQHSKKEKKKSSQDSSQSCSYNNLQRPVQTELDRALLTLLYLSPLGALLPRSNSCPRAS